MANSLIYGVSTYSEVLPYMLDVTSDVLLEDDLGNMIGTLSNRVLGRTGWFELQFENSAHTECYFFNSVDQKWGTRQLSTVAPVYSEDYNGEVEVAGDDDASKGAGTDGDVVEKLISESSH